MFVSQSHNNQIYNNTISKSRSGINLNSGSSNNKIFANTISHSISNAILVASGESGNTFTSNKIVSATPQGLEIEQDPTSKNNIFTNNQLIHSSTQAHRHSNVERLRGRPRLESMKECNNQRVHKLQEQHHTEFRGVEPQLAMSRITRYAIMPIFPYH